jgi:hypothetical protein
MSQEEPGSADQDKHEQQHVDGSEGEPERKRRRREEGEMFGSMQGGFFGAGGQGLGFDGDDEYLDEDTQMALLAAEAGMREEQKLVDAGFNADLADDYDDDDLE